MLGSAPLTLRRLSAALLLAACGNGGVTIAMVEQNNSGQNGTATLFDSSAGLDITVTLRQPAVAGRQASHVHLGRCDDVGPIVFGISMVEEGGSGSQAFDGGTVSFHQVLAGHMLSEVRDGNHVINVHDPRENSLYVSCGEIEMSAPLDYKNALVTGASSGIGRGLVVWLAKRNIKVWAAARRLDALEALKAEAGENVVPLKLDISDSDATEARVRQLDAECGGLDLVVANAGVGVPSHPKKLVWPLVANMLKVNVLGATATICGALPGMVERQRGHIVGISSIGAFGGIPRLGAYCGTKAYLATYLQGLRLDAEKYGIVVSTIHPGYVKSEMTADLKNPPFLMETQDAVEEIGAAILRGARSYTFPWQMSLGMKTLASLPRPLYEAAARKMR